MRSHRHSYSTGFAFFTLLGICAGCAVNDSHQGNFAPSKHAHDAQNAADLAYAQRGKGPYGPNTIDGGPFGNSSSDPTEWCADFLAWVWQSSGYDVTGLTAGAGSFMVYGQNNCSTSDTPHVGDAIVYNYDGNPQNPYADHVEIVRAINPDGTVQGVSGNGCGGTVCPDSTCGAAGQPCSMYSGWTISGFVSPVVPGTNLCGGGSPSSSSGGGPPAPPSGGGDACATFNDGDYCGNDPNGGPAGDPNTLYTCTGGVTTNVQPCPNGCQAVSGTQNDCCNAGSPPPPPPPSGGSDPCAPFNDGDYCGNDPNGGPAGDPNTLYTCTGGVTTNAQPCPNGCQDVSGAANDFCN